jgi:hypothetical protein
MKTTPLFTLLLAAATALQAGEFEIDSLTSNGRLTFTNAFPDGLYTIEWAPGIQSVTNQNGTNIWLWDKDARDSWDSLKHFATTSRIVSVEVPMFYRVTCLTNQFTPTVIGRQFTYTVTNTAGSMGTMQASFVGCLRLSSGEEYSILEMLTPCAVRLLPCRSTATEFYTIPFGIATTESVAWRSAPAGTTWTNEYCDGSSDQITIGAKENITVPAGTFDCLRIEQREINNNLSLRGVYWIKAGLIMVRQFDIKDGQTNVSSLASWADRPPR